jgi:hypothetical protein
MNVFHDHIAWISCYGIRLYGHMNTYSCFEKCYTNNVRYLVLVKSLLCLDCLQGTVRLCVSMLLTVNKEQSECPSVPE